MRTSEEVLFSITTREDVSIDECLEAMKEYADQFKPKWIDIKDRIPEIGQRIIWYLNDEDGEEIWIGEMTELSPQESIGFTHWMPIPIAP